MLLTALLVGCVSLPLYNPAPVAPVERVCPAATPTAPPPELGLDPFYARYVDAGGVPIVGSDAVPDGAFRVATHVLENMLRERPCYREALMRVGVRVALLAPDEQSTDLPEFADLNEAWPGTDWGERARGLGANHSRPVVAAPSENLSREPGDPYMGESVLVHEFGHTLLNISVSELVAGPRFRARLEQLYARAVREGLWEDTYAQSHPDEYWAEGVQTWVGHRQSSEVPDGVRGPIDTRAELWGYDPALASLIAEVMPSHDWYPWCDISEPGEPAVWPALTECPWRQEAAEPAGCEVEGEARSVWSERPGELSIINRRAGPVEVFWLDGDGLRVGFGEVPRWYSQELPSPVGYRWLLADVGGDCLGVFEVTDTPGRGILE